MRVKLVFLAGSLAAFVVAMIFGADMCSQIAQTQQQAALEAGEASGEGADGDQTAPNVAEGGVQNVNENLRKMKSGMQEQMDRRGENLDDRIERSASGK